MVKVGFATCFALTGLAQASTITFETAAYGNVGGFPSDADAYRAIVDQAFAQPGSLSAVVSLYDNLSNQTVFGASASGIAYRATINFGVSAADAGSWSLRLGGDFGYGAALFLDGQALTYNPNDIWWNYSYKDASQSLQAALVSIGAGNHTLQLYGLENCCDGSQQAQFSINGADFITFGSNDGLIATIPEPEPVGLALAGAGLVGFVARRKAGQRTAA